MLAALLPEGVAPLVAALLVGASFLTSALTAAAGIGGGLALLAIMGAALPVAVLIPVHGVVQLGSNAGRAVLFRRDVRGAFLAPFLLGALPGALAGAFATETLPDAALKLLLAAFVLYLVWGPRLRAGGGSRLAAGIGGAATTFLTMLVGATGPLVGALVGARGYDKRGTVGTMAAAMTAQHALKAAAFGFLGFAFADWAPLIAAMIATGFLGTLAGARLLGRIPEAAFRVAFRWLLTALALNLALGALAG